MECPLCLKDTGAGKTAIVKHLSSHLEEISLGALPSGLGFDSESEDESQDTEDAHSDSSSKRKRSLNLDTASVPTDSDALVPREDEVPDGKSVVEDAESDMALPASSANILLGDLDPAGSIGEYRSQQHTSQVWESHKGEICRLYLDEDRTLEEVMAMMRQRGFRATVRMYKSRLDKWCIYKNRFKPEVVTMLQVLRQRNALGKRTSFQRNEREITIAQRHLEDSYALAFIDRVKAEVGHDGLNSFQDILKATLSERADCTEAMHRASELFHGHAHLFDECKGFLPSEHVISRTEEEGKLVATMSKGANSPRLNGEH